MADSDNYYAGRRPSFNRAGQIRGLRSRPGAPLADPTKNIGAANLGGELPGFTPRSHWESLFHNSVTGGNTATGVGTPVVPQAGEMSQAAQQDVGLSLDTLARGGVVPHQQRWMQPYTPYQPKQITANPLAGTGYETGNQIDILNKYQTPGTTAMTDYGWGKPFQNFPDNG